MIERKYTKKEWYHQLQLDSQNDLIFPDAQRVDRSILSKSKHASPFSEAQSDSICSQNAADKSRFLVTKLVWQKACLEVSEQCDMTQAM